MKMLNKQLNDIHGGNPLLIQSWLINTLTTSVMIYGYDYYNNIYKGPSMSSVIANDMSSMKSALTTELDIINQKVAIAETNLQTLATSSLDYINNALT